MDGTFTDAELIAILPKLRSYAIKLTSNGDTANDLVQYTAERMLQFKHRFDGSNIMAWAFTIMRNRYIRDYRVNQRSWMTSLSSATDDDGDEYDRYPVAAPYDHAAAYAAREVLHLMFNDNRVSAKMRQCVLLVCMDGMTMEEAGVVMGVKEGTIKSRLFRAREIMKEYT